MVELKELIKEQANRHGLVLLKEEVPDLDTRVEILKHTIEAHHAGYADRTRNGTS